VFIVNLFRTGITFIGLVNTTGEVMLGISTCLVEGEKGVLHP
jgi:hypothetical protein